jgi:hypothetical protein
MQMSKLLLAVAMVGLLVVAASAASVDGKWKAETTGRDGQTRTTNFTFKVDGEKLTGTVSGRQGDTEISEGKISGDEISFIVVRNFQGEERKMQYKGKVAGDEIKFARKVGDFGGEEFVAKRAK